MDKYRILIVDDNADIHKDIIKVLVEDKNQFKAQLDKMDKELLGSTTKESEAPTATYEIDSAYQGEEALNSVSKSLTDEKPYALIFLDVLMPPGWDGVKTAKEIWKVDPNVHIVLCTAYADYSWEDIIKEVGLRNNFLILKKPFENIEIRQMACCLTEKWKLTQQAGYKYDRLHQEVVEEAEKLKILFENIEKRKKGM